MNWQKLFTPGVNLSTEQAKEFMAARSPDDYQLLDVRQPSEYEQGHLAGALLIPLKELPDRLGELHKAMPTLVYCAVGGRSKVAAQLLAGQGFDRVFNISGGIKAWHGSQATGPEGEGLELFTGQENYEDGLTLAYAMEGGLQSFYRELADTAEGEEAKSIYRRLMGFEDRHKNALLAEYRRIRGGEPQPPKGGESTMEGGGRGRQLAARLAGSRGGPHEVLEFAMALETQALDLYWRMARKSAQKEVAELFVRLAAEEKTHLAWLADQFDRGLTHG